MKRRIFLIVMIVILIVATALMKNNMSGYSRTLDANWGFKLPAKAQCIEIYDRDSGESFHGDGIRFHVFEYENDEPIRTMLPWASADRETIFYESVRETAFHWLTEIQALEVRWPEFEDCVYWYASQADNSEILVFWDEDEDRIYVIESFL